MGSWADLISLLSDTLYPFRVQVTPVTALMVRTDWANHSVLITRIFALILSLSHPSAPVWLGLCQGPAHFILIACALSWDWFASLFSSFLHILSSLCRFPTLPPYPVSVSLYPFTSCCCPSFSSSSLASHLSLALSSFAVIVIVPVFTIFSALPPLLTPNFGGQNK